jgi:hypothetical protein
MISLKGKSYRPRGRSVGVVPAAQAPSLRLSGAIILEPDGWCTISVPESGALFGAPYSGYN